MAAFDKRRLPRSRRVSGVRAFWPPAKTSDLTGFTPGRSSPIRGAPMGPVPWGGKPGYEDRKADLEAKLAE